MIDVKQYFFSFVQDLNFTPDAEATISAILHTAQAQLDGDPTRETEARVAIEAFCEAIKSANPVLGNAVDASIFSVPQVSAALRLWPFC